MPPGNPAPDRILDREKHPQWQGERTKMVYISLSLFLAVCIAEKMVATNARAAVACASVVKMVVVSMPCGKCAWKIIRSQPHRSRARAVAGLNTIRGILIGQVEWMN